MSADTDALAFLYLTFAHATDGALSGDEMRALADRLRAWQPDTGLDAVGEQIKAAVARYKQLPGREQRIAAATQHADALARSLSVAERQRVLEDLQAIAEVDGHTADEELAFLAAVRAKLGV